MKTPLLDVKAPLTLNDIFAALPTVSLIVGYLLTPFVAPITSVELRDVTATYVTQEIGEVPGDDFVSGTQAITANVPLLGPDGKPKMSVHIHTAIGRGQLKARTTTKNEVTIPTFDGFERTTVLVERPRLGLERQPPPSPVFRFDPSRYEKFIKNTPRVTYRRTNVFEVTEQATFENPIPETYAVWGGALGSLLSLLYFAIRIIIVHKDSPSP